MARNTNVAANAARLLPSTKKRFCARLSQSAAPPDQVGVMPRLRPVQAGRQEAGVSDARGATITCDLVGMYGQHFDHGEVIGHSASFI
jgi:hypothetical protein